MLDLWQTHSSLVDSSRVAQRVLAAVIYYDPGRGAGGFYQALCDAGGIAMSKDRGPIEGHYQANGGRGPWRASRFVGWVGLSRNPAGEAGIAKLLCRETRSSDRRPSVRLSAQSLFLRQGQSRRHLARPRA